MNIYVGNLPYRTEESELRELFEEFGEVISVRLITDRATGRKKGFGFVEMSDEDAATAIQELDQTDFGGRNIRVNEAHERKAPNPMNRF